ncbi:DUF4258 domain-containing protein [Bacillus cereus]|nr:DUF4258 domain-containing protein [Bacillus cereus]
MKLEFSRHAQERIAERHITRGGIVCAVLYGNREKANKRWTFEYTYKDFVVVVAEHENGKMVVVSCEYTQKFTKYAKKFAKQNGIGFYKALRRLRESNFSLAS